MFGISEPEIKSSFHYGYKNKTSR